MPRPRLVGGRSTAFVARFCMCAPARYYPDVLHDWARGAPAPSAHEVWVDWPRRPTGSPRRTSNAGMPPARGRPIANDLAPRQRVPRGVGQVLSRIGHSSPRHGQRLLDAPSSRHGRPLPPSRPTRRGAVRQNSRPTPRPIPAHEHISNRFADVHHRSTNRPNRLEPWWIFQVWRRP